jgi:Holliday junction resolvase RusA-like endonuclease
VLVIRIPGELRGKGRPRMTAIAGRPRAYTDAKTATAEAWVRTCAAKVHSGGPLDGAVTVTIDLNLPVPASWSKKRRALALAGTMAPITKPDLDNVLKLVGDALNGIVWRDDRQIVRATISRRYAETAEAIITVGEA